MDRCHLIPAQRLRKWGLRAIQNDSRILVRGCRQHHMRYDGIDALHKLVPDYGDFPQGCRDFARENGLYYDCERGWKRYEVGWTCRGCGQLNGLDWRECMRCGYLVAA